MSSANNQVILITGASRGIGFSIVQATALRYPSNVYLLGCRSHDSGLSAISQLREKGVKAELDVVELDVTNDESILKAKEYVERKYGRLNVLVNNAGIALFPTTSPSDPLKTLASLRETYNETFDTNITSITCVSTAFLPLLRSPFRSEPGGKLGASITAKIINISSGRASLQNSSTGNLPPTAVISYSISKAAVNGLTIEMQKVETARQNTLKENGEKEREVEVFAVNPGHCKTAFNGFRGTRDPVEGAEIVVRIVGAEKGVFKPGSFLEFEGGEVRGMPW